MYLKFYNLTEKPFSVTADPNFLYLSKKHKEAISHMQYGIQERMGFIEITGEIGAGKTTVCKALLNQLDQHIGREQFGERPDLIFGFGSDGSV